MAFASGSLTDLEKIGSGEIVGDSHVILSEAAFEDGLKTGHFAKVDAGSLDNIDASTAPVIAGVVLRDVTNAVQDGDTIDSAYKSFAEFCAAGLVTVQAVAGESPEFGDAVFAYNVADADAGKASVTDDGDTEPTNAIFVREIDAANDIWLVRLV